jgi:CubicO group peptidase (beta-lactamase class C family)
MGDVSRRAARAELVARARRDVDDGVLPSCQLALARGGELLLFETIGATPAGPDTRYVAFSCTKGVFASAIWAAVSDGALSFDTRVVDLIPEFATNGKDAVTVHHLLTMTAGFPRAPLGPPAWATHDGRRAAFAKWRLDWPPGSQCEYHANSAGWVLAELLGAATGVDHRDYLRDRVMAPLGLALTLGASPDDAHRFAEVVPCGKAPSADEFQQATGLAGVNLPDVADEHLLRFNDPAVRAVGQPSAGAVGSAADLALYYQALLHNPDDRWDPDVLHDGTAVVRTGDLVDAIRGVPALRTRGMMLAGDDGGSLRRGFGRRVSPRAFGHDGAGGQVAWADPQTGVSFAYVTNGLDANILRMARRGVALSDRAATIDAE